MVQGGQGNSDKISILSSCCREPDLIKQWFEMMTVEIMSSGELPYKKPAWASRWPEPTPAQLTWGDQGLPLPRTVSVLKLNVFNLGKPLSLEKIKVVGHLLGIKVWMNQSNEITGKYTWYLVLVSFVCRMDPAHTCFTKGHGVEMEKK